MAENPQVALAATVHAVALPLFGNHGYHTSLDITLRSQRVADMVTVKADCKAHEAMADHAAYWGERLPSHPADLFAWCLEQPQDVLLALLAYCTASSVNAVQDKFDNGNSPRLAHASVLAEFLALDMASQWQPSVEGFYNKLSKAALLMLAKDAGATLSLVVGNVKKLEAARDVMQAIAQTNWLPQIFRNAEAR
jgi:ParB family chromosome partitioning protein